MARISLQTQLAAIDAAIHILRRYQLPPRSQADLIAEQLGSQRDHVAEKLSEFNKQAENRSRSKMRERLRNDL
jgi:hypothetical protein